MRSAINRPKKLMTGCVACRKMESVMEEVKQKYPGRVNVVFLNILKLENQMLMKYYGVAAIPTQVLLNKKGKEFYRHTGFIQTNEVSKKFQVKCKQPQDLLNGH